MADFLDSLESFENVRKTNYEKYKDKFTSNKNDLITIDNFYSLLIAEMQNQDPLEPTSNTEFISQMASFTALQSQQDAFKTQQQSYANSLVGQTVTVATDNGDVLTGQVSYVSLGESPTVNINGKNYQLSAIRQVHPSASSGANSIGDYGAFASSLLGKNVVVQYVNDEGVAYYDEGTVKSLEIENGEVRVIVNGYAYSVSGVVKVTEAEQTQQTQQTQQTESVQPAQAEKTTSAAAPAASTEQTVSEEEPAASVTEAAASQQTVAEDDDEIEYTEEEDIEDLTEAEELKELFNG